MFAANVQNAGTIVSKHRSRQNAWRKCFRRTQHQCDDVPQVLGATDECREDVTRLGKYNLGPASEDTRVPASCAFSIAQSFSNGKRLISNRCYGGDICDYIRREADTNEHGPPFSVALDVTKQQVKKAPAQTARIFPKCDGRQRPKAQHAGHLRSIFRNRGTQGTRRSYL